MKNYTIKNNQVKIVRSSMSFEGFQPTLNSPISSLKNPLTKVELSSLFSDSLVNTYTNYYFDDNKHTRIISILSNNLVLNDSLSRRFQRVFNPKKDTFFSSGYGFNVSSRTKGSDQIVLTIENFEFDYSLLEVKNDYPLFLFSIQFIATYKNGLSKKLPAFIIPVKIADSNWLKSVNYENFYTGEFTKENFKSLEVRIKEIYLNNIHTSEVDAIIKDKTINLPEALKAISLLIKNKELSQS